MSVAGQVKQVFSVDNWLQSSYSTLWRSNYFIPLHLTNIHRTRCFPSATIHETDKRDAERSECSTSWLIEGLRQADECVCVCFHFILERCQLQVFSSSLLVVINCNWFLNKNRTCSLFVEVWAHILYTNWVQSTCIGSPSESQHLTNTSRRFQQTFVSGQQGLVCKDFKTSK